MTTAVRPVLSAEFIDEYRRQRVAQAVAEIASEEGLQALTVKSICARCAMGRAKFYELFKSAGGATEDALERAFETTFAPARRAIHEGPDEPLQSLEAALDALLATLVEEPRLAELCLVHSIGVPANHGRHWQAGVEILRSALADAGANGSAGAAGEHLRPAIEELLCRSILTVGAQRLRQGRPERLQADRAVLLGLAANTLGSKWRPPVASA